MKKVWMILLILSIFSCSTSKKIINSSDSESCLSLDPINYHNSNFNSKWLSNNGIKKIIEREYLDGRNGKIHSVSVLYINSDGFLKKKYSGLSYPENDSPNENDLSSKWDYTYEIQDSFLIQKSRIVRFHNEKGKMEKPDTLGMGRSILNMKSATTYHNEKNEIARRYKYDDKNRLIEVIDGEGKSMFKLEYLSEIKIRVEKYSYWSKEYKSSWVTFNKNGQIIKNYDESNNSTHEFLYNEKGEMIEDKSYFKNKEPIYYTFEYVK